MMEHLLIPVGINIGGDGNVGVSHKLLCHVDGDPGPLEVGAEGVAEAVGGEIGGDGVLDDLAPPNLGPHVEVQSLGEGIPQATETVGTADAAVGRGKDRGGGVATGL